MQYTLYCSLYKEYQCVHIYASGIKDASHMVHERLPAREFDSRIGGTIPTGDGAAAAYCLLFGIFNFWHRTSYSANQPTTLSA